MPIRSHGWDHIEGAAVTFFVKNVQLVGTTSYVGKTGRKKERWALPEKLGSLSAHS